MAEGRTVIRVTWALVALVVSTEVLIGLLLYGAVEAKLLDKDVLKYFAGLVFGSVAGGALPIVRWFKEKRISFAISDSDPPTPNNRGDGGPKP